DRGIARMPGLRTTLSLGTIHVNNPDLSALELCLCAALSGIRRDRRKPDIAHWPVQWLRAKFDAYILRRRVPPILDRMRRGGARGDPDRPRQDGLPLDRHSGDMLARHMVEAHRPRHP